MKITSWIIILFFICLSTANATSCQDMMGTYRVAPFIKPAGLTIISQEILSKAPIGMPIFKVTNKDNKIQHIGLIHQNTFDITLIPTDKNHLTILDYLFENNISTCSYQLDNDTNIIQVDLSPLNQQQLENILVLIRRLWGSDYPDIQQDHEQILRNNYHIQYYTLDKKSLSNVKYFFTKSYREIGVGGMIFVIPLQKISDKSNFTVAPDPFLHQ